MKKLLIYSGFCIALSETSFAQLNLKRETWNWHFGYNCGLNFSSGSPVPINSACSSFEGSSSISSKSTGQLLFYTNGERVWNKNHIVMPNGSGLNGDESSTQSSLIVPFPNDTNKYYIFTTDQGGYVAPNIGMYYSVVDMTLNNGLGDVSIKNNVLLSSSATEKVAAVSACNKKDSWVVTHEFNSNKFYAYPVTSNGVGVPVITQIGSVHSNISNLGYESAGALTISNDGNKLALVIYDFVNRLELFDFNRATGVVSNSISMGAQDFSVSIFQPYGLAFSPDNTKLYVTHTNENFSFQNSELFQLDISNWSKQSIVNSKFSINTLANNCYYALAQGPDARIYATKYSGNQSLLDVIANPNGPGPFCGFSPNAVNIPNAISLSRGLPNFMISINENIGPVCVEVGTAITESDNTANINAYPVPAREMIKIPLKNALINKGAIKVYDIYGKEYGVEIIRLDENEIQLSTRHLSQGIYVYKIYDGIHKFQQIGRIVVE